MSVSCFQRKHSDSYIAKKSVAKSAVHINIYVITWIVPLCYYNGQQPAFHCQIFGLKYDERDPKRKPVNF
jgi:hypothetical protein